MADRSPDISVIIATYNVEAYIERAIRSALDQDGVSLEVIVADDGSTDATWSIVSAIDDPRLHRLLLPENGGPSLARNAAIAAASGQFLAILDGDDAFLPGRLQRCLAKAKAGQADIVVDNLLVRREEDGAEFVMFPPARLAKHARLRLADFIAGNVLLAGGYSLGYLKPIFAAKFLQTHQLRYDPDLRIGEDYLLLAEALALGAVCAVEPAAGYAYTVRAGSISHRLCLEDIDRMAAADAKFQSRHRLDPAARRAQRRRTAGQQEMRAYTRLIDALKAKDPAGVGRAIAQNPKSLRQLWRPIWVRLRRMFRKAASR